VTTIAVGTAADVQTLRSIADAGGGETYEVIDPNVLPRVFVREIRVVAERDSYGIDEWEKALEFKEKACRDYSRYGISSVTKKHLKKE